MVGGRLMRRRNRRSTIIGSCLVLLLIVITLYNHTPQVSIAAFANDDETAATQKSPNTLLEHHAKSWRAIFTVILKNDPQCSRPPKIVSPTNLDIAYRDDHAPSRPDIVRMHEADVKRMRSAHANFVGQITTSDLHLIYNAGTRGIVMTVSDTQIPVLLVSLRMLRETQSNLPVEVFLWQAAPYTAKICETILPSLNAKCVFLHDVFREASTGVPLESYQFKVFAILFSSFEDVLLLDADAWPTSSPDDLFTSAPFTDSGLILWPDFWFASESPYYFNIAGIRPPPLTYKPATEAGQLMYSKSKHENSIILATYYNYFGPEYYYPLQSQGGPGQGDKETFGLAALALNESFYAMKTSVIAIGRNDSSGHFWGSAMVQHDPRVDLLHRRGESEREKEGKSTTPMSTSSSSLSSSSSSSSSTSSTFKTPLHKGHETTPISIAATKDPHQNSPASIIQAFYDFISDQLHPANQDQPSGQPRQATPQFIHANFPKFDPRTIFADTDTPSPTRDSNGTSVRCWDISENVALRRFGVDIERRLWRVMTTVACEDLTSSDAEGERQKKLLGTDSPDKASRLKEKQVCALVRNHVDAVFGIS